MRSENTGKKDPWTPPARVEGLQALPNVEKVIALEGADCFHARARRALLRWLVQELAHT